MSQTLQQIADEQQELATRIAEQCDDIMREIDTCIHLCTTNVPTARVQNIYVPTRIVEYRNAHALITEAIRLHLATHLDREHPSLAVGSIVVTGIRTLTVCSTQSHSVHIAVRFTNKRK